jgi:hypothetical protein
MLPHVSNSLVAGAAGLGLVAVGSLHATFTLVKANIRSKSKAGGIYKDKDGVSNEEESNAFSATRPKIFIALSSVAGFAIAIALAVLSTLSRPNDDFIPNWDLAVIWVSRKLLAMHCLSSVVGSITCMT